MLENLIGPLLCSILIYCYLPATETNVLVVFQSKRDVLQHEDLAKIGNVKYGFKIIKNVDGHMQHVEISNKMKFNYAIVTENMSEKDIQNFKEDLPNVDFVESSEIFTFKTNPVRLILMNLFIKIKGIIFDNNLVPSHKPLDDIGELCHDENYKDKKPKIMINVVKENKENKSDIDTYSSTTIFKLFPKIGASIFELGKAEGDYWDMVALMQYPNYKGLCNMAKSEEFMSVHKYKVTGLLDTHTYWTQQIF